MPLEDPNGFPRVSSDSSSSPPSARGGLRPQRHLPSRLSPRSPNAERVAVDLDLPTSNTEAAVAAARTAAGVRAQVSDSSPHRYSHDRTPSVAADADDRCRKRSRRRRPLRRGRRRRRAKGCSGSLRARGRTRRRPEGRRGTAFRSSGSRQSSHRSGGCTQCIAAAECPRYGAVALRVSGLNSMWAPRLSTDRQGSRHNREPAALRRDTLLIRNDTQSKNQLMKFPGSVLPRATTKTTETASNVSGPAMRSESAKPPNDNCQNDGCQNNYGQHR